MAVKMILATDRNWGIGKNNSLPWKFPEDLQYFKECTQKGVVIMGSRTFRSLPFDNGLPERNNLVITRSNRTSSDFVHYIKPWGVRDFIKSYDKDLWVIGGAETYKFLLPYVDEIHHTLIQGDYDCDTFFNLDFLKEGEWSLESSKPLCDSADVMVWKRRNDG